MAYNNFYNGQPFFTQPFFYYFNGFPPSDYANQHQHNVNFNHRPDPTRGGSDMTLAAVASEAWIPPGGTPWRSGQQYEDPIDRAWDDDFYDRGHDYERQMRAIREAAERKARGPGASIGQGRTQTAGLETSNAIPAVNPRFVPYGGNDATLDRALDQLAFHGSGFNPFYPYRPVPESPPGYKEHFFFNDESNIPESWREHSVQLYRDKCWFPLRPDYGMKRGFEYHSGTYKSIDAALRDHPTAPRGELLRKKFAVDPDLKTLLLRTGDKPIRAGGTLTTFGRGNGWGEQLMALRSVFQEEQKAQDQETSNARERERRARWNLQMPERSFFG